MALRALLFGRPIRTEEEEKEQLGVWSGIPVLGLDALASASYGPEAALTVLLPLATTAASGHSTEISLCILGVLGVTFLSYRQTIPAYPHGGGSYTVAKENLGRWLGVLAASALAIDYILNVALAISAGVGALVSAVPVFRLPTVQHARLTLTSIVAMLGLLLTGIGVLAHFYHVGALRPGAVGFQSVISQLVAAVMGRGAFYFVTMTSVLAVLALSANTSFADFPRVCRVLAQDEYLPAEFAHRGSRLVYSAGTLLLALSSALLLIVFGGITDRLIPLFAVGAFLAFTLSQLGMVFHWRRTRGPHAGHSLVLNGACALATGGTLIVIIVSKFAAGAWITVLAIPLLIWGFSRIRSYHEHLDRETDTGGPLDCSPLPPSVVVIPMKRMDRVTRKALRLAMSFTTEVRVVQIVAEELKSEDLSECWDERVEVPARSAGLKPLYLKVVYSPYREFFGPLLEALKKLGTEYPDRTIAVMIPEMVERRWWHFLIRRRATMLEALLLLHGGPRFVLITTPWYVNDARLSKEMPAGTPPKTEIPVVAPAEK